MALKTAEDVVSGEASVIEQAIQDLSGVQPDSMKPQSKPVVIPIKKF